MPSTMRAPDVRCAICGGASHTLAATLNRGVQILACCDCTNAITYPAPVAEYDDHQFFTQAQTDEERWRRYSRQIAEFLVTQGRNSGRLLDVGSSHGLLLEEARRVGFAAEGIEPSRTAVERSRRRGLAVTHGYLTDDAFPAGSFDVIVMSHVIEHVADPAILLRTARELLRPGGVVCLCQTNYRGTLPRWLGRRWDYWVAHEHYFHFSPAGIHRLLRQAGLDLAALKLLPLGYHWTNPSAERRTVPGAVLHAVKCAVSHLRLGLPYEGDQMYVLAHEDRKS